MRAPALLRLRVICVTIEQSHNRGCAIARSVSTRWSRKSLLGAEVSLALAWQLTSVSSSCRLRRGLRRPAAHAPCLREVACHIVSCAGYRPAPAGGSPHDLGVILTQRTGQIPIANAPRGSQNNGPLYRKVPSDSAVQLPSCRLGTLGSSVGSSNSDGQAALHPMPLIGAPPLLSPIVLCFMTRAGTLFARMSFASANAGRS